MFIVVCLTAKKCDGIIVVKHKTVPLFIFGRKRQHNTIFFYS